MKILLRGFVAVVALVLVLPSCTYKLSLNGSTIPTNMKTIRVDFFENNAPLVVNTLSTSFTEALKDRIRTTTRLSIVRGEADGVLSGSIVDFSLAPASVQATSGNQAPIANQSRLSITVNVKYVNDLNKKDNFEQTFTKFENYNGDINAQQATLIADITKQLTEDIFNKAFDNW